MAEYLTGLTAEVAESAEKNQKLERKNQNDKSKLKNERDRKS